MSFNMQYFRDTLNGDAYEFDDDVMVAHAAGIYTFFTPLGVRVLENVTTLEPHTPSLWEKVVALKAIHTNVLTAACGQAIVSGYTSSALGSPHVYPSDPISQQNMAASVLDSLVGGTAPGWTTPFLCADADGVWAFRDHTSAQIRQAGTDGKTMILEMRVRLVGLQEALAAASTEDAVQAVVW